MCINALVELRDVAVSESYRDDFRVHAFSGHFEACGWRIVIWAKQALEMEHVKFGSLGFASLSGLREDYVTDTDLNEAADAPDATR